MESIIRKISIGSDYKNEAMHYSIGQVVYGGHEIAYILKQVDRSCIIYIKNGNEVKPWKEFYPTMAIALEFDLEY
tara:strand:+ start:1925 stop:2149 length:225 start_codon:yes stop_codon:yes gene_type:complete